MNKRIAKYKKIIYKLIEESFPNLKDKTIFITEFDIPGYRSYSAAASYLGFFSWVTIGRKSKKYSDKALIGLFAHELSHLDIIVQLNFIEKIFFATKWVFTKKAKMDFETDADTLAVKKGYGKELCEFKSKQKTYDWAIKNGYLTIKQVKNLMKK